MRLAINNCFVNLALQMHKGKPFYAYFSGNLPFMWRRDALGLQAGAPGGDQPRLQKATLGLPFSWLD
jgi:hypothetical protein